MSEADLPSTIAATFIVRFWREATVGEGCWRGRIEHVPSGERAAFLEIDAMLSFLRRFEIPIEDHKRIENPH
jgi:hypothetical protein